MVPLSLIPIFVIIFPILGPEYPLTTAAAIGTALMTEVFGFSSGFIGYYRKGLIDFRSALPFIRVAIPVVIVGALMLALLKEQETFLKAAYAVLMIVLCSVILKHTPRLAAKSENATDEGETAEDRPFRTITGRTGKLINSHPAGRDCGRRYNECRCVSYRAPRCRY